MFDNDILIGAVAVIVFLLIVLLTLRKTRVTEAPKPETETKVVDGVEAGTYVPDYSAAFHAQEVRNSRCIYCTRKATEPELGLRPVHIDRMRREKLRLQGVPIRYTIGTVGDEERLCVEHRRVAETRLERFLAELRADASAFNTEQETRIATMNQGGLDMLIRIHDTEVQARLTGNAKSPQLES